MPVSIYKFKAFAGWDSVGQSSVGSVEIRRNDPLDKTPLPVLAGYSFTTDSGLVFKTTRYAELDENSQMIEIPVRAVLPGVAGNIPAMSLWEQPHSAMTLSNPDAFTGGTDKLLLTDLSACSFQNVADSTIQDHLESSTDIVRDMLGFSEGDPLPESSRIDQAIYTLALFFIESRSSNLADKSFIVDEWIQQDTKTPYRDRIEPAIYRRVVGLINPWRNVSAFMPEVSA